MSDISTWCGTGRLGGNAETRTVGDGTVTSFDMAVSHGYGDKETTSWFRCSYWGRRGAAITDYLRKGSAVTVTGEFSTKKWTDKQGQVRDGLEIRVTDVKLPPRGAGTGEGSQEQQRPPPGRQPPTGTGPLPPDSDIPF